MNARKISNLALLTTVALDCQELRLANDLQSPARVLLTTLKKPSMCGVGTVMGTVQAIRVRRSFSSQNGTRTGFSDVLAGVPYICSKGQFDTDEDAWENLTRQPRSYVQIQMDIQAKLAIAEIETKAQNVSERLAFVEFIKQEHAHAHEAGSQAMDQGHERALARQQQNADSMARAACSSATTGREGSRGVHCSHPRTTP